MFLMKNMTNI